MEDEKVLIAEKFLIPSSRGTARGRSISPGALRSIRDYTHESGVRVLDRQIAQIAAGGATRGGGQADAPAHRRHRWRGTWARRALSGGDPDQVGVATGLARRRGRRYAVYRVTVMPGRGSDPHRAARRDHAGIRRRRSPTPLRAEDLGISDIDFDKAARPRPQGGAQTPLRRVTTPWRHLGSRAGGNDDGDDRRDHAAGGAAIGVAKALAAHRRD